MNEHLNSNGGGHMAFVNARVFDGRNNRLLERQTVVVERDRIVSVDDRPAPDGLAVIDCSNRVLMPGLIDAHVHAYLLEVDAQRWTTTPPTLYAHHAAFVLGNMLNRGFTTVRDVGGADYGLALAIDRGYFPSPRLIYCEKFISITGGHGDLRNPKHYHGPGDDALCGCGMNGHISALVDGVPQVLQAVRENLRRGANFIKIMGSGGVSSTGDKLEAIQFSDAEIRAVVEEVERHETYCTAHAHPDRAVRRAIELGVHGIEHATLIEPETAALAAERNVAITPTISAMLALSKRGEGLGFSATSLNKLAKVVDEAVNRLGIMKKAGVRLGFGTDLMGPLEDLQTDEFQVRRQIFSPFEILVQATSQNAEIVGLKSEIGVVAPGYLADLIVVDGNPLAGVEMWTADGAHVPVIMKAGKIHRNRLDRPAH